MGKAILLTSLAFIATLTQRNGADADLFRYDRGKIEMAFAPLKKLESAVSGDSSIAATGQTFMSTRTEFQNNMPNFFPPIQFEIDPYAFFWGYCCSPIGVFVVMFDMNQNAEGRISFLFGATSCVLSVLALQYLRFS